MAGHWKLPNPSLNRVFNVLSIGGLYALSFQWTYFGLKCLYENLQVWFEAFFVRTFIFDKNKTVQIWIIVKDVESKKIFFSANRGNDVMKQCNILVYVWFTTSKAGLDFYYDKSCIRLVTLPHDSPNDY